MKIVCLGDSFTKGFGVDEEKCWASILGRRLSCQVVNKGINGDTTGGMLARFYRDVAEEKPRYVLIDGGFNDLMAGAERGTIQANIMSLVHQAYHYSIVPIILSVPGGSPNQFRSHWPAYIDIEQVRNEYFAYRLWLKDFCKGFSVFFIDCFEVAENTDFAKQKYIDGIHMTPEGHEDVAEYIINFFKNAVW